MASSKNKKITESLYKMGGMVDKTAKDILNLQIGLNFKQLVDYQMLSGGKRLRPALLFVSCRLLGGGLKDAIYPAAGVEILHNYSLIIDDIIDKSEIRRGKPTLWKKHGKDIAQCVGIIYAASIFQSANASKNPILISDIFIRTMKELVEGEILDILQERYGRDKEPFVVRNRYRKISKNDYLEMVKKKTARLCESSCKIGGICAGGTKKQVDLLGNYGFNAGIAFQIQDDLLDIFGDEKKFGKEIGKDIKERKGGNIAILFALEELKSKEKSDLSEILAKKRITKNDVAKAVGLIEKTEAKKRSQRMADYYIKKAKESLKFLPKNQWNEVLDFFADFAVKRSR